MAEPEAMKTGNRASDLILAATLTCWAACSTVLGVQLGYGSPGDDLSSLISLLSTQIFFPAILLCFTFEARSYAKEQDTENNSDGDCSFLTRGLMGTVLRGIGVVLLALPFVSLAKTAVGCHGSGFTGDATTALVAVAFTGHVLICLLMGFENCYGVLLAVQVGVVSVSFAEGFSHDHHRKQYLVSGLSLLVIVLSDVYLSIKAREDSDPVAEPRPTIQPPLQSIV